MFRVQVLKANGDWDFILFVNFLYLTATPLCLVLTIIPRACLFCILLLSLNQTINTFIMNFVLGGYHRLLRYFVDVLMLKSGRFRLTHPCRSSLVPVVVDLGFVGGLSSGTPSLVPQWMARFEGDRGKSGFTSIHPPLLVHLSSGNDRSPRKIVAE